MDEEPGFKIKLGEKGATGVKAFLVLPVAALHLAIMSGCVRANELVLDTQLSSGFLKKGLDVPISPHISRDCRYAMSCVILFFMKDRPPLG